MIAGNKNGWTLFVGGLLALMVLMSGCASKPVAPPFPAATPEAVVTVTRRVFPAVVRLDVAQEIYSEGKRNLRRGIGSGVIIDDDGHILTNFHVAGRAAEIYVTLANKERVPAKLIGDDHWADLAVVQMDMNVIKTRKIPFNHAELGNSAGLIIGQDVIAIGTPFGLARTMTLGIVSNNERTFYPDRQMIDEYETGMFTNWIQMDTPIAPGNSGGPLVDMNGYVVGINTRGIAGQSLNFAIPIDAAKEVIAEILRTARVAPATTVPTTAATTNASIAVKGHVDRSDLGIDLKPLQDLETYYDIDINRGVLVNSIDRGSPAAKAGVKAQDILLTINGAPTNARFPEELAAIRKRVASMPIGSNVTMQIKRGRENITLATKTEKLQSAVGEEKELKAWGLSVRDITRAYANDEQLDDDLGVVVTTKSGGSPADKADLRAGDVIRAVNQKPVEDLEAFMRLYDESVAKQDKLVLLDVTRGRGRRSAVMRITY